MLWEEREIFKLWVFGMGKNSREESSRDFAINKRGAALQPDGSYINEWGNILYFDESGGFHRAEGPAIIFLNGAIRWCLNNTIYSFNEWLKLSTISDEDKMMLRLRYGYE